MVAAPSFMKITSVDQSVTPEITHYNTVLPGNFGDLDGGVHYGKKEFTVNYTIIYDGVNDLSYYTDKITKWLKVGTKGTYTLSLDSSGDYYMARPSEVSELRDMLFYATGSIKFTASNPRRYKKTSTAVTLNVDGTSTEVSYAGLVDAPCFITLECGSGTTSVKVTNSAKGESIIVTGNISGTLYIDTKALVVKINNVWRMDLVNINTDWFKIYANATNKISIVTEGTGVTSAKLTFTEAN